MKSILAVTLAGLFLGATALSAQTITMPGSVEIVAAADDYATQVLQDPWDMNARTDLGWFTFAADQPFANLANKTFTNGIFSATPTSADPNFWLLDTGIPSTIQHGRDGKTYPIDGTKYRLLMLRMRLASSAVGAQAQVLWSNDTIYGSQGLRVSGGIPVSGGWNVYAVNLATHPTGLGPAWPGTGMIDSLRFDPTQIQSSGQVDLDWVRLVDNSNAALSRTITWTGGGSYNIFLSSSSSCSDASRVASNAASHTYQLYVGGLPPGTWYVGLGSGASPTVCSPGYFQVGGVPTMSFTAPGEEGSSDDFATVRLGNPWDFTTLQDIDTYRNITGLTTTAVAAETESGVSLGTIGVLAGTSTPATAATVVGDPHVYPLYTTQRGLNTRIDTSRYRILTFEMSVARDRDLFAGSVARVVWKVFGEPYENVTEDIILRHLDPATNGGRAVFQKITFDMADRAAVPIDPGSPGQSGWIGVVESLRLDPHEFSNPTGFYIRRARLAAFERANTSYAIALAYDNPAGGSHTVSFYYDTDRTGFNGVAVPGCQNLTPAASVECTWDTSALPNGALYHLYAVASAGSTAVNRAYARWPVRIDHVSSGATLTSNRSSLRFRATANGSAVAATPPQEITLTQAGGGTPVAWQVSSNRSWFTVSPGSGSGTGKFTVRITPGASLQPNQTLDALLTVSAPGAENTPLTIPVAFSTAAIGGTAAPIGALDTPLSGATGVTGSIGVTGWAIDDVGMAGVKVYRNCFAFDVPGSCVGVNGHNLAFVGDGTFLAGARPDVEAAFASHPASYSAGWGLLVLTNMLPHVPQQNAAGGGQGPVTFYAFATDLEGNRVLLGTRSITLANDQATAPFGAIDTPGQGGTASGSGYANFGWALTPGAAKIPTNGSTIQVVLDGAAVGTVDYNHCRGTAGPNPPAGGCNDDVAQLFPGTRNITQASGAMGAFVIDTTALANGLHTIAWGVTDDLGRTSGIGSRFFTVFNGSSQVAAATPSPAGSLAAGAILGGTIADVAGRVGFDFAAPLEAIRPDGRGVRHVAIPEFGRLELHLPAGAAGPGGCAPACQVSGRLVANGQARPLPPGSQLDTSTGTFTWTPGPGYLGSYELRFARGAGGEAAIVVTIAPATRPAGAIRAHVDLPAASATVPGRFTVAGWALDTAAWHGAGIAAVHVWAVRRDRPGTPARFLGAAALGGARPDVAAGYGASFEPSGWSLTAALEPGAYDVMTFYLSSRTGRFEDRHVVALHVR